MLEFFHEPTATSSPNTLNNPKRFLVPTSGIKNKHSVLYMIDNYVANLEAAAVSGATTLQLNKTDEFLNSGTAFITSGTNNYTITYTGKTSSALTGVSGITAALNVNDSVKPWKIYKSNGNFVFIPQGPDLANIQISLGSAAGNYNFPGTAYISTVGTYDSVVNTAGIPVYLSVDCLAGAQQEFTGWSIVSSPIYTRDKADSTPITATEIGNTIKAYGYLFRRDNFQINSVRLLPATREISTTTPGFVLGQYRWRDNTNENSVVVIPTKWDPDISSISLENFIYGVAREETDLLPVDLENVDNSIYLRIQNGFYFAGSSRFYLPSNPQIQFINANQTGIILTPAPDSGSPIFVGNWILDVNNFYQINVNYRYQATGNFNTGTGSGVPQYQYTINKKTNLLTLNLALQPQVYFLGLLTGQKSDFFNVPVYPVDSISAIYVDRGIGNEDLYSSNYTYDRGTGVVTVTAPSSTFKTSIPNANVGEPVYAMCNSAYAVVYDSGSVNNLLLDSIDLNPAFAGISNGYVYLQHRRQAPISLTLSADKPIIDIPATYANVIDLVAYGPIYFTGDYALLTIQAFGPLDGEIIPNAEIQIIPGPGWAGTINYQDPTVTTVTGITGADGKVNFLYVPDPDFGYYIPAAVATGGLAGIATTTIANDTLILPTALPIDEVFSTKEGWFVDVYNVINTDPLFGLAGGNAALGQIPFTSTGTPGTISYATNGQKVIWANGNVPIQPSDARDINNNSYTNPSFNGTVVKLIFNIALETTSNVGSYFITFVQRVSLQAKYVNSDVLSNTILLEMAVANTINQDPWLTLNDATQGILNQYRLGWQQDLPNSL